MKLWTGVSDHSGTGQIHVKDAITRRDTALQLPHKLQTANTANHGMEQAFNTSWSCYTTPMTTGVPLSPSVAVADGFYNPNATNDTNLSQIPVFCPPSIKCSIIRLGGKSCEVSLTR
jgi:hypothetical protein